MGSDDLSVNRACPLQSAYGTRFDSSPMTPKKTVAAHLPALDTFSTQTPLVVIGLAALGMIFLINSHAQPTPAREKVAVVVVLGMWNGGSRAVRATNAAAILRSRSSDARRLIAQDRATTRDFSVGDIVRVSGNVLTLESGTLRNHPIAHVSCAPISRARSRLFCACRSRAAASDER